MNIYEPRYTNENAAREHLESAALARWSVLPALRLLQAKRLPAVARKRARSTRPPREGVVQCNETSAASNTP